MKSTHLLFLLIAIAGCQPSSDNQPAPATEQTGSSVNENEAFNNYLSNFKSAELPLFVKGCKLNPEGLTEFNDDSVSPYADEYTFAYRQIPSNGDYIAVISLGMADCLLPILTTFTAEGETIDQQTLAIGQCGSDCGYTCEEFLSVGKDYSIYVSDTISSAACDSLGNILPETLERYIIYKNGKLLTNGKIQLSEEIRKPLDAEE